MTLNSYFTLDSGWLFGIKFIARRRYFAAFFGVFRSMIYMYMSTVSTLCLRKNVNLFIFVISLSDIVRFC